MGAARIGATSAAHWRTWRPYTLWYVGLVGLAGQSLVTRDHAALRIAAAWGVPTLVWVAAHYLGDYLDRELDAISKPQRPIPSGLIRPGTALACGIALSAGGCALALAVNWRTATLLATGIGGAIAYNGFFKARGLWGNLVRGLLTGAAFVFGQMMASAGPQLRLLPLALVFWAHDAGSNLVGALRDVDGDRAGGYVTFPVRYGVRIGARTAAGFYALAVAIAAAGAALVPRARTEYLLVLLAAAAVGFFAFRLVLSSGEQTTARTALRSHAVLVAERLVLADALLVPGLGLPAALLILAPMLAVTVVTQRTMRTRHEFPDQASRSQTPAVSAAN